VNWFRHYGFGFHAGDWLVILLALVPGIALLKLPSGSLHPNPTNTRAREIIGAHMADKRVVSTQEIRPTRLSDT
jgi:hypothetical protein